jgi:hypothetical protein
MVKSASKPLFSLYLDLLMPASRGWFESPLPNRQKNPAIILPA